MRFLVLVACLTAFVPASADTFSSAQESKATTTYQVPTTGEIMDVTYRPEFDEWWVKCREGKGVSVYSYDKRSKKWGRALFVPQRPGDKGKKTAKPEEAAGSEESTGSSVTKGRQPEKLKEPEQSSDGAGKIPGSEQQPRKSEPVREKKKWWDPLNLLKGDKKTDKKAIPLIDQPLP